MAFSYLSVKITKIKPREIKYQYGNLSKMLYQNSKMTSKRLGGVSVVSGGKGEERRETGEREKLPPPL